MKKILSHFSRVSLGILFVFSGFVKSVEPLGTSIKLTDYLNSFNLEFFNFLTPTLSVVLSAIEVLLGLMLLTSVLKKLTSLMTLIFMLFFTLLTLYIYIFNPVSDCGCFGDAFIISNGETFLKNIFFSILAIYLFISNKHTAPPKRWEYRQVLMQLIVCLSVPIYAYIFHPAIEFLPYKVGVNIKDAISNTIEQKEMFMLYKNKQSGNTEIFSINDTVWYDTAKWEFVEIIDHSSSNKIISFDILTKYGQNISDTLLSDTTMFLVARDITNLNKFKDKIEHLSAFALKMNYTPIILTSSSLSDSKGDLYNFNIPVYNMDETMIKSFVRANVGVVITGNATVLSKDNIRTIPMFDSHKELHDRFASQSNKEVRFLIFYCIVFMFIITFPLVKKYTDEKL